MTLPDHGELAARQLHSTGELAADALAVHGGAERQTLTRGQLHADAGDLSFAQGGEKIIIAGSQRQREPLTFILSFSMSVMQPSIDDKPHCSHPLSLPDSVVEKRLWLSGCASLFRVR